MDEVVRESELVRPDGRRVAWTEYGPPDGLPLLRIPGVPGSRWAIRSDRTPWRQRGLFVVTSERPGFGRSTRLPGRGFTEHADDLAAALDHLGVERVYALSISGGAPHLLAFCARHPDRVRAATSVVGVAPWEPEELGSMIGLNAAVFRAAAADDRPEVERLLAPVREATLADPLRSFAAVMDTAPDADRAVISDPAWQSTFARAVREALTPGLDGWVDEVLALAGRWSDIDVASVSTSITWWHAPGDRNTPISAARRMVDRLPDARLLEWPADGGHLYGFHHEAEILDDLLARG